MPDIMLKSGIAALMALALVACDNKEGADTQTAAHQSPIDTPITATTSWKYTDNYSEVMAACPKINTLTHALTETIATTFGNPMNDIRFIETHVSGQKCYITVTTPNGPKSCYVPAVIDFGDGRYSAAAPPSYKRCP